MRDVNTGSKGMLSDAEITENVFPMSEILYGDSLKPLDFATPKMGASIKKTLEIPTK